MNSVTIFLTMARQPDRSIHLVRDEQFFVVRHNYILCRPFAVFVIVSCIGVVRLLIPVSIDRRQFRDETNGSLGELRHFFSVHRFIRYFRKVIIPVLFKRDFGLWHLSCAVESVKLARRTYCRGLAYWFSRNLLSVVTRVLYCMCRLHLETDNNCSNMFQLVGHWL